MATTTAGRYAAPRRRRRGFVARALGRVADAQMQQARAVTKPHLLALSDADLRTLGYTRDEISRWPSGAHWL